MAIRNNFPPRPDYWPTHLMDEKEAAHLLGFSPETLRDWRCRKLGTIPYVKMDPERPKSAVKYCPDQLWRWQCRNTVGAEMVPA